VSRVNIIKTGDNYGLCNRLFPFAHLIASATEYGWALKHLAFSEFSDYFEGTSQQSVPVFPPISGRGSGSLEFPLRWLLEITYRILRKLKWHASICLGDHDTCDLSEPNVQRALETNQSTQLVGLYFYDSVAFQKHADLVRRYFRPVQAIRELVTHSLRPARESADVVVGVHIRHGDYQHFCGGIMYYTFAEYAQLMRTVSDLFPGQRVSFLICSNAQLPDEEFDGLRIHSGPGHVVGDVYALAECDYIVGPPSTYSEWASFYGEVPRYMHRAKDYEWNGQKWPGVTLQDFVVHREGFARCSPTHPASLIGNNANAGTESTTG